MAHGECALLCRHLPRLARLHSSPVLCGRVTPAGAGAGAGAGSSRLLAKQARCWRLGVVAVSMHPRTPHSRRRRRRMPACGRLLHAACAALLLCQHSAAPTLQGPDLDGALHGARHKQVPVPGVEVLRRRPSERQRQRQAVAAAAAAAAAVTSSSSSTSSSEGLWQSPALHSSARHACRRTLAACGFFGTAACCAVPHQGEDLSDVRARAAHEQHAGGRVDVPQPYGLVLSRSGSSSSNGRQPQPTCGVVH